MKKVRRRQKVCKKCRIFVESEVCPICNGNNFSSVWKGMVIINNPSRSEIAKLLGIKQKGKYAIWVK